MTDSGCGYLEMNILDLKLDKTIMEKSLSVVVEIDNRQIASLSVGKTGKRLQVDISNNDEIMELKICAGAAGREGNHIGM